LAHAVIFLRPSNNLPSEAAMFVRKQSVQPWFTKNIYSVKSFSTDEQNRPRSLLSFLVRSLWRFSEKRNWKPTSRDMKWVTKENLYWNGLFNRTHDRRQMLFWYLNTDLFRALRLFRLDSKNITIDWHWLIYRQLVDYTANDSDYTIWSWLLPIRKTGMFTLSKRSSN